MAAENARSDAQRLYPGKNIPIHDGTTKRPLLDLTEGKKTPGTADRDMRKEDRALAGIHQGNPRGGPRSEKECPEAAGQES